MQVQINGETRELSDHLKLSELVKELSLVPERVAIELNQHIVRRTEWTRTILSEGDRLEIVHFVGGGTVEGRRQEAGSTRQEAVARVMA